MSTSSPSQSESGSELCELWDEALIRFNEKIGVDPQRHKLSRDLKDLKSEKEIVDILEKEAEDFNRFRAPGSRFGQLRKYLKPIVAVVIRINEVVGEASSSIPGGKTIFVAFGILLKATQNVSNRYDTLSDLFKRFKSCVEILDVLPHMPSAFGRASRKIATDILVHLLDIITLSMKTVKLKKGARFVHTVQSLVGFGDDDMQNALNRLITLMERLTTAITAETQAIVVSAHDNELLRTLDYVASADITAQDPRGCMEGTRIELLASLEAWSTDDTAPRIFWLDGMAGTGKSAVARSFSRCLHAKGLLGGSFFCSRTAGDPARTDVKRILPTLATYLARNDKVYRKALLDALEKEKVSSSSNLDLQIEFLMKKPFSGTRHAQSQTLVLVIDALDECSDEGLMRDLLERLIGVSFNLPVKFFFASRPEQHIRTQLDSQENFFRRVVCLHDIEKDIVGADIFLYLKERFKDIRVQRSHVVPQGWPDEADLAAVANRAGKLIIYAFTAIEYIRVNPKSRLRHLIECGDVSVQGRSPLDTLYSQILSDVLENKTDEEVRLIKRIFAAILTSREPLSISLLSTLLDTDIEDVKAVLDYLHAVLRVPEDDDGVVSTFHASFGDFLTSSKRAPQDILIALSDGHSDLSAGCIAGMRSGLYFNLSNCRTSYLPNDKQKLADVPLSVQYSCLYWSDHIMAAADSKIESLCSDLELVFKAKFLFWVEALSAMEMTGWASEIIRKAMAEPSVGVITRPLKEPLSCD